MIRMSARHEPPLPAPGALILRSRRGAHRVRRRPSAAEHRRSEGIDFALDGPLRAGRAGGARPSRPPAHLRRPRADRPRLPLLRRSLLERRRRRAAAARARPQRGAREVDAALRLRPTRGPGHQPARHRHRAGAAVDDRAPRRGAAAPAPGRDGGRDHLRAASPSGSSPSSRPSTRASLSGRAPSSTSDRRPAAGRAHDAGAARGSLARPRERGILERSRRLHAARRTRARSTSAGGRPPRRPARRARLLRESSSALEERSAAAGGAARRARLERGCLRVGDDCRARPGSLSLVAANYGVASRNLGTVSLIGPQRMDYSARWRRPRRRAALSEFVEEIYDT